MGSDIKLGKALEAEGIYFNPRSPCGERPLSARHFPHLLDFNPRSPCGERQVLAHNEAVLQRFQSTLPVWGATAGVLLFFTRKDISIHAPRVGSDVLRHYTRALTLPISIHAPRVGSDTSRLPISMAYPNFNPRSPCGERRVKALVKYQQTQISIHAPRVGSDGAL